MKNIEGQNIPESTFIIVNNNGIKKTQSKDFFAGRKVVVFSLPGAFTPTCSTTHVPRYNELTKVFKTNGIDEVVCISVNDSFVMDAWKKDQQAENITFLPDGNGNFTDKMGLLVDKSDLGFGKRSWRYSMLVNDGKIEKMFLEPEKDGDPFEVSDADTMLKYINPNAKEPDTVTLFTREGCGFCARAKEALDEKSIKFDDILLGRDITYSAFKNVSQGEAFPQIFVNGKNIGGCDELIAKLKAGQIS